MVALVFLAALIVFHLASAHSNIGYPLPYNKISCKASAPWCKSACPPIWGHPSTSPKKPAAIWKRGQTVQITWHKNNHIGGFYRRSLVPVKHMWKHAWHKKTAFDYGCWSQGSFKCGRSALCGDDLNARAYRNYIRVPNVYPDGDYVFAQVWYGGLHWQGKRPKYSDYFGCSFVSIRGGTKLRSKYTATWTGDARTCRTGSTRTMQCGGESCEKNKVMDTVPDEFKNNKRPVVYLSSFGRKVNQPIRMKKATPKQKSMMAKEEKKNKMMDKRAGKAEAATTGPLKRVVVFVNNRAVKNVVNGERAVLKVGRNLVTFEAITVGERPATVEFRIARRKTWIEYNAPFVYQGNRGRKYYHWKYPIYNREFKLTVRCTTRKGRHYTINVLITLKK